VSRRPGTPEDEPFLRKLVIDTVSRELGADAWPQPMRDHLLDMQYRQRRDANRGGFPDVSSEIVLVDGAEAGWIVIADLPDQIHIVDIMVREDERGRGVGSTVIVEIQAAAKEAGKPVRLGVNTMNGGAIRLYLRLGFRQTGGDEAQQEMEWASS